MAAMNLPLPRKKLPIGIQTPDGKALQQIITAGYADKYQASGQPIHLIGVEFSKTSRSVVGFETQILQKN